MSLKDWFRRKPGPQNLGTSKGGSSLLKYDSTEATPATGLLEESSPPQMEERERIYGEIFGQFDIVYHELPPLVPHIDVYRCPPSDERDFYTFVTGGMSDLPMNSPPEHGRKSRRIELVFYAAEDKQEYSDFLRCLAHFAHDNNTWLHWAHTMPNGAPPAPIFGSGSLDTMLFMPSIVSPDSQLGERFSIDSDPVNLVWCVPITTAECQYKLDQGTAALYELLQEKQHPFVFSGDRESYV